MPTLPAVLVLCLCLIPRAQAAETVYLFAASSLTGVLDELSQQYSADNSVRIVTNYAASSTLARQITQGAPADIYISANRRWMDYLEQQREIESDSRRSLISNRLVLVAPASTPDSNSDIPELSTSWPLATTLDDQRFAVADPAHVPAGRYAREALQTLQLWQPVRRQLTRSHNVRAALALVERGEVPLGIVYQTDARQSARVTTLARIPTSSHSPIEYPIALVKDRNRPAVSAFYRYLQSDTARQTFTRHGFEPVHSAD